MKKNTIIRILIIALIIVFSFTVEARASKFKLKVDKHTIDFSNLNLGETKSDIPGDGFKATCTSDLGNPWELKISNIQPLTHEHNPTATIPDTNFRWYGISTTGAGTLIKEEKDFTQERVLYSAPAGEGANGIDIIIKFKLIVPQMIQAGEYETQIMFTMTE